MQKTFPESIRPRVVEFLDSLLLSTKREPYRKIAQVTFLESDYSKSSAAPKNHTMLYQTRSTKMVLRDFLNELGEIAGPGGHPLVEGALTALLSVCIHREGTGENRAKLLETFFESLKPYTVHTYYIFDQDTGIRAQEIDGVNFGPMDLDRFKSRLIRSRIPGAQEQATRAEGKYVLEFPERQIRIASLHDKTDSRDELGPLGVLEFNYYANIAKIVLEESWERLAESQALAAVKGQEVLRVDSFRDTTLSKKPCSCSIFIDPRTGKSGYFIKLFADHGDSHLPEDPEMFKSYEAFQKGDAQMIGDSPDYRLITKAARIHQQALENLQKGKTDDATLYGCICLEILLGDDEVEGKSHRLAERASTLIMQERNVAQISAYQEIKRLYNSRSEFVHTGQPVSPNDARRIVEVTERVLQASFVALGRFKKSRREWCENLQRVARFANNKDRIEAPGKFYEENGVTLGL
jgi:hypothetical protein